MNAPTREQQDVIDAFAAGRELRIQAGAGAGKTSTLKLMAAAKPAARGVYVAYNRDAKLDAARSFPRNVRCYTSHGLAYPTMGKRFQHRFNAARVPAYQAAEILKVVEPVRIDGYPPLTPAQIASCAIAGAKRFTHSADPKPTWRHVPRPAGYTPAAGRALGEEILPVVKAVWQDWTDPGGRLRYEQDAYLKQWALYGPKIDGDFFLLDEAQDSNAVVTKLVLDQAHLQRIAVGDSCQQLYAWRGAEDSLGKLPGESFNLSQSFRFGPVIAQEANRWLDLLDAPLRLTGFEKIQSRIGSLHKADAILCRTNAGCMSAAMELMADGTRVALVGGAKSILAMAYAAIDLKSGRPTTHPELVAFDSWGQVRDYVQNEDDGADLKPLVDLIEKHGPDQVIRAAKGLKDEKSTNVDVKVSTAHKSKGLEWSTVKIGSDFYAPKKDPETGKRMLLKATAMLCYVAVTRAREVLDCESLAWINDVDGIA